MKFAVQAVILNDNGEVLSVSRKDDHNDAGLVGGKVDPEDFDWVGEEFRTPQEVAMFRECKEETGLNVNMESAQVVFQMHKGGYMGITYLITDWSGEIETDEPHIVKWTNFETIIKGTFGKWNTLVSESLKDMGIKYLL